MIGYTDAQKREITMEHVRKFVLEGVAVYRELIHEHGSEEAQAAFVAGYIQACATAHYGFWRPYD